GERRGGGGGGTAGAGTDGPAGRPVQPHDGQPAGGVHGGHGLTGDTTAARIRLEQRHPGRRPRGGQQHVGLVAVEHVVRLARQHPVVRRRDGRDGGLLGGGRAGGLGDGLDGVGGGGP